MMKDRDVNVAMLAKQIDLSRAEVRRVLSGKEDMSLDQLILFSDGLGLSQSDLAASELPTPAALDRTVPAPSTANESEIQIDPWGNQPEQLFRVAFALGCNFFFLTRTDQLEHSGVPDSVLERYDDKPLPIKLDAAFHLHNKPKYEKDGITLVLSFDTLYECTFPWSSIIQIVFFPAAPTDGDISDSSDEDPKPKKHPHLRLLT